MVYNRVIYKYNEKIKIRNMKQVNHELLNNSLKRKLFEKLSKII